MVLFEEVWVFYQQREDEVLDDGGVGGLLFQLGDQLVFLGLFAFEVGQQTEGEVLVQL